MSGLNLTDCELEEVAEGISLQKDRGKILGELQRDCHGWNIGHRWKLI